ncbi:MAG: hypothetical protein ACFFC7_22805 [Candidatus Hermodarchaeota archaeon]
MSENTNSDTPKEIILSKKAQLPAIKLISFPQDIEEFLKVSQDENRRLRTLAQTLEKNLVELRRIFQNLEHLINIENPDPQEVKEYLRIHLQQGYDFEISLTDLINFLASFPSVTEENLEHIVIEAARELNYSIIKKSSLDDLPSVLVNRKWFKRALKSALDYILENFEISSPALEISLTEFEEFILLSVLQQDVIHTSYFPEEEFTSLKIRLIETIVSAFGGKFWVQLGSKPDTRFFRSSITGTIERQHFSKITLFFTLPYAKNILK